jgi:hypothetical protein
METVVSMCFAVSGIFLGGGDRKDSVGLIFVILITVTIDM